MEDQERTAEAYGQWLYESEKSSRTVEKYVRDVRLFLEFCSGKEIGRETVLRYKQYLMDHYRASSVNSMLASLNGYLKYIDRGDCRVKLCRMQRQVFLDEKRLLNKEEYHRLVRQAQKEGNDRLACIFQTIGSTGIRVGELPFITVECLKVQLASIYFKGKVRVIVLPKSLTSLLKNYCRRHGIRKGSIFVTRNGRPVDRRNVWAEMKALSKKAGVAPGKVYPHSLRHLFARLYYEKKKDVVRLADYLGHSSVETTRRYTMISTAEACRRQLELGLLFWGEGQGKRKGKGKKKRLRTGRHNAYYVIIQHKNTLLHTLTIQYLVA